MPQRFSPSNLKRLREDAGVTRGALAYATRRTEQSVWLWERGKTTPRVAVLENLAEYLGCSIDDLFEDVRPADNHAGDGAPVGSAAGSTRQRGGRTTDA